MTYYKLHLYNKNNTNKSKNQNNEHELLTFYVSQNITNK